jgi:uncharacterized protein
VVASCYEFGYGCVAQDSAEAMRLYSLAAAQGDADAQVGLGVMFENGQGVAQDRAEAIRWYRLAAEQGDGDEYAIRRLDSLVSESCQREYAERRWDAYELESRKRARGGT